MTVNTCAFIGCEQFGVLLTVELVGYAGAVWEAGFCSTHASEVRKVIADGLTTRA